MPQFPPMQIRGAMELLSLFSKSGTDRGNVHQAAEQDTSNQEPDGPVVESSSASRTRN